MARDVRKNFNLFVNGKGYAGNIEEFNAPKLSLKLEEWQGGGMHGPIEITLGHEKLETDFTLLSYDADALALWGVVEGREIQFTAKEALESDNGTVTSVEHSMRGKIKEFDPGNTKAGEKGVAKFALTLSYYRLTHGARIVQEIDIPNMIVRQGGVDALAAVRAAIGI